MQDFTNAPTVAADPAPAALAPQPMLGEIACLVTEGSAPPDGANRLLSGDLNFPIHRWVDRNVALAWQGAAEAAISEDIVVMVEGRLDNRAELASRAHLPNNLETAVLVAALWREHGADLVDEIVGDLSGVVVERSTSRVHAFRDLCAGRPLHVGKVDGAWAVASEWRPLAFANRTSPSPNPEWFVSSFLWQSIAPHSTPYLGVEMVLPGHVASSGRSGWEQARHADWHIPTLRDTRPGAYADQFRELFDEAVRCRIASATPAVGVCLSGGLDSTSTIVTAHAVDPGQHRVALCLPMFETKGDERAMQEMVAQRSASELRWVDPSAHGPLGSDGPESVFARFGAPPLSINWFLHDALAEEARAAGLNVVLTGEDGDGVVGGSPAFLADLLATGRWLRWLREVNTIRKHVPHLGGRQLFRESVYMAAPPAVRRAIVRRQGGHLAPPILAERLRTEHRVEDRLMRSPHNARWRFGGAFRLAQTEVGMAEQMGPIFTSVGQLWRPYGLSIAHPWCDRRLMSFCMGLPYVHIVEEARSKIILRQAMADRLPEVVLKRRTKADLSEVSTREAYGRGLPYVKEGLRLARRQTDWFDAATVDSVESAFDAEKPESQSSAIRVALFASWLNWCGV